MVLACILVLYTLGKERTAKTYNIEKITIQKMSICNFPVPISDAYLIDLEISAEDYFWNWRLAKPMAYAYGFCDSIKSFVIKDTNNRNITKLFIGKMGSYKAKYYLDMADKQIPLMGEFTSIEDLVKQLNENKIRMSHYTNATSDNNGHPHLVMLAYIKGNCTPKVIEIKMRDKNVAWHINNSKAKCKIKKLQDDEFIVSNKIYHQIMRHAHDDKCQNRNVGIR